MAFLYVALKKYSPASKQTTNLRPHLSPLSDLGRETALDGGDRPPGSARVAGNERQTVLSLAQLRVGRPARLARHVLDDVLPQHVLQLLRLETTLDDQTSGTSGGAARTQFGEQECGDVLLGPLHTLANLGKVGEDGLLVAFTHALGRWDLVALGSSGGVVGVLLGEKAEESALRRMLGTILPLRRREATIEKPNIPGEDRI